MAGRSRSVVVSFLYWSLCRLLELVVLRFRSEREKEIEILLLRHQLRVLERRIARPQLTQADRALLAAFSRVLPRRARRNSAFVTPATLLRWHRPTVRACLSRYRTARVAVQIEAIGARLAGLPKADAILAELLEIRAELVKLAAANAVSWPATRGTPGQPLRRSRLAIGP